MKIESKLLDLQLSSFKKDITMSFLKMIGSWTWKRISIYWYCDGIDITTLNSLVWYVDKVVNKYFKHFMETTCFWDMVDLYHWNDAYMCDFIVENVSKIISECTTLACSIVEKINKFIYDWWEDEHEEIEKKILEAVETRENLFRLEDDDKWEI